MTGFISYLTFAAGALGLSLLCVMSFTALVASAIIGFNLIVRIYKKEFNPFGDL